MQLPDWKMQAQLLREHARQLPKLFRQAIAYLLQWQQEVLVDVVALEIKSDNIKLLQIDPSETPFLVKNYIIEPVPEGLINKSEIQNYDAVADIIRDMFKKAQITNRYVALAIPKSLAIIKNITIDSRLSQDDIESRAWIEANRHFPELVGDIYLDFSITGVSQQDASQLDVVLVACRKDHIKPYIDVLQRAGLVAKIVDINCYALERALPLILAQEQKEETVGLLNLSTHLSTLIVAKDTQLLYAHDQNYDGERLLTLTSRYLESNPQATLEDPGYDNILKETLLSHLRHTVHFFYSSRPNIGIKKIILAGECASVAHIASFIQREIGVETVIANPMANLTLSSEVNAEEFKKQAPALMECCGLALSKVEM